jgi:DNA replication protein DnaC
MHIEQTLQQMRALGLTQMAQSTQTRMDKGEHKQVSCDEFLGLLIEEEFHARKNRKLSRLIGLAKFKPEGACLENIKYKAERGFGKSDINRFRSEQWLKGHKNAIFLGPTGVGKTYLAEAAAMVACRMGYTALKLSYKKIFEEILSSRGTGQYLKYLDKISRVDVLLIDDFGMGMVSDEDTSDLMEILEERVQKSSTLVTSQYPMELWHTRLPDPTMADAICDRLISGAFVFNIKGESLRKGGNSIDENGR